ncbi:MAG TPA: hypothetical protein DCS43_08130 [Verrucomicrobia bacterium]|nr:hypothetical protein [Verrucomicrobiota bacterium]
MDGTGKPNFEKFKAEYAKNKNLSFSAIQFHPNNFGDEHFTEYELRINEQAPNRSADGKRSSQVKSLKS